MTFSSVAIVSAQSQPKQLTKEEEQKKQKELQKKIKEALDGAVSDVALLKNLENKTFFQTRTACLLWNYDEKTARLLLDDAQGLAPGDSDGHARIVCPCGNPETVVEPSKH
jgi:hypothetical protein